MNYNWLSNIRNVLSLAWTGSGWPRHLHGRSSCRRPCHNHEVEIITFTADAAAFLKAVVSDGQWVWANMQRHNYQQYLSRRDDERQRRNAPIRWIHTTALPWWYPSPKPSSTALPRRGKDLLIIYMIGWHMRQTWPKEQMRPPGS